MTEIVCTMLVCVCCVELYVIVDQARRLSRLRKILLGIVSEDPVMTIEMTEVKADGE